MAERFGNYVVHERLGAGGMATVHRATLSGIGGFEREVALKRLLPHLAHDENFVRAFVREARIAAQLRHPNVAQTFDLGLVGESYYIAMELIEGVDMRNVLKASAGAAGPMPPSLVVNLLTQVCDALDYAHRLTDELGQPLGIVHRDVSPANIIVNADGIAKLIDFGIAKASSSSLMTMSGQLKGKFAYIAPETIGGTFDARADLFSLGIVAHELLTAQPLLAGADEIDTLRRVREHVIELPSKLAPGIPEDVDSIVMTALARNPDERWQSAAAMRGALGVIAARPNLRSTTTDLVRWIQWAMEVRPSARRAAVSPRESARRRAAPDTDVESIDQLPDDTSDGDSMEVSMVVERPGEPITADKTPGIPPVSPSALAADYHAAELGAAPAEPQTLEFLVGSTAQNIPHIDPNSVRLERTTAGMRTPNLTRRTPSRPQSAQQSAQPPATMGPPTDYAPTVDMSLDGPELDARTTGRISVLPDDGDAATTGTVPVFDSGPDPQTIVDIPEDHILAEIRSSPQSMPTLMIHAGVTAAPDAVMPGRPSRPSAPPLADPYGRMQRASDNPPVTARSSAVPPPGSHPPSSPPYGGHAPYGSQPPHGHAAYGSTPGLTPGFVPTTVPGRPATNLPTMVAAGTPRGVSAAPQQPEPYVALGEEYSEAAASYAANVMTPPPGMLMRPDPARIAEEAIRDDQARRRSAHHSAQQRAAAAAAADAAAAAADVAGSPRRSNTGATILLLVLSALIGGGAWAAYYFT